MFHASKVIRPSVKRTSAPGAVVGKRSEPSRPAAGHLEPGHAARLRRISHETDETDTDVGFLSGAHSRDDLTERLGEGAVFAMTSGESQLAGDWDKTVEEEQGGPFVETLAEDEFATGTDESNIAEATREPFPKTSNSR